jgi:RNA recognition motif-containing protein
MLKNIFIGCMPFGFSEEDIRAQFEPYGRVVSIELTQDLAHATIDAYAHVLMETDQFDRLLNELDGKSVGNRVLRVNEVVTREDTLLPDDVQHAESTKESARS